jgi:hypothetical protein
MTKNTQNIGKALNFDPSLGCKNFFCAANWPPLKNYIFGRSFFSKKKGEGWKNHGLSG